MTPDERALLDAGVPERAIQLCQTAISQADQGNLTGAMHSLLQAYRHLLDAFLARSQHDQS